VTFLHRRSRISARVRWSVRGRIAAAAVGAMAAASLTAPVAAQAAAHAAAAPTGVRQAAAASVKPGLTGKTITVAKNAEFSGYDLATGPNGTAYLGWIGDTGSGRLVHLCSLPRGAKSCAGGIKTIASAPDSIGESGAAGLRVLVNKANVVTLVWEYSTVASENGPEGDKIAIATSEGGGPLSNLSPASAAPSFGYFLDATLAPNGKIWAVTETTGSTPTLQVTRGLGAAPQTIKPPFSVGRAELAFTGTSAVLAIDKDGAITQPVYTARQSGNGWTGFKPVAKTWNLEGWGMATSTRGVRLIASENNADYHPVVTDLTSTGWTTPGLTGDLSNCFPSSHDVVADASGRLADVSIECSNVAVADLPDTGHAAIYRFYGHGTFAGGAPQLTTAPSGRGWVAWSIEAGAGNALLVSALTLPGLDVKAVWKGKPGEVVTTGPASCLPPVDLPVGVAAKAAAGWKVAGASLKLGPSPVGSVLHGAALAAARTYTLTGTVLFAHGSTKSTGHATVTFRTCPAP
jgi:hypothetical protein